MGLEASWSAIPPLVGGACEVLIQAEGSQEWQLEVAKDGVSLSLLVGVDRIRRCL